MTENGWIWISVFCVGWLIIGLYALFFRNRKMLVPFQVGINPRVDQDVIVSNTKIMVNVLFAEHEKDQATPGVLADFVISYKDIVKGSYEPVQANSENKGVDISDTGSGNEGPLSDDDMPDLSDQPEVPEPDLTEVPERGPDEATVYEESELVDSNTLILNMYNP
ncbi:MAG: hypothetical protein WAU36_04275 [Cyclobacteriaceae bacterium]